MLIAAKFIDDVRLAPRFSVELDATLRDSIAQPYDVSIDDLSHTGFRLIGAPVMPVGTHVSIGFAGIGIHQARLVRREGDSYGCEFVAPLTRGMLAQARSAANVAPTALTPASPALTLKDVPAAYVRPYPRHTRMMMIIIAPFILWGAIAAVCITL